MHVSCDVKWLVVVKVSTNREAQQPPLCGANVFIFVTPSINRRRSARSVNQSINQLIGQPKEIKYLLFFVFCSAGVHFFFALCVLFYSSLSLFRSFSSQDFKHTHTAPIKVTNTLCRVLSCSLSASLRHSRRLHSPCSVRALLFRTLSLSLSTLSSALLSRSLL